jgi:hypothetical protein
VFVLSGFAMGTLGHVSTLRAFPWLPLILLAFERWMRTRQPRDVALGAAAIGIMLLAGHPQIPLYALLVSGAYAAARVAWGTGPRLRIAAGVAAAFALGALLAAVQILPTLQLAREEYLRPGDRGYDYFATYSLSPALLVNLVFPRILAANEAELAVYAGITTLVLALVACLRPSPHRFHRHFFGWAAVVALVLAFGQWTVFGPLLFHVPLFNLFTAPARNLFELHFALAALAAMGVDAIREPEARASRRQAVLVFAGLTALGMTFMGLLRDFGPHLDPGLATLAGVGWSHPVVRQRAPIVLASLALVLLFPTAARARLPGGIALLALAAADLSSYAKGIYRLDPPAIYETVPAVVPLLERAGPGRIAVLRPPRYGGEQATAMLYPDTNAVHGIESVNGFDSMMLRQVDAASGGVMPTHGLIEDPRRFHRPQFQRFLDLLNTRHVLTPAGLDLGLAPPRYRPVYADDLVRVFENADALPRAFVAPDVRAVTHRQALEALATGTFDGAAFDPRRTALAEAGAALPATGAIATAEAATAAVVGSEPGRVRIAVRGDGGLLVHSASYSGGWKAWVDGAPAPVYRTDGLLQGVPVGAGRHEVVLAYRPRSFAVGAALSLAALVLILVLAGPRAWIKDRTSRTGPGP